MGIRASLAILPRGPSGCPGGYGFTSLLAMTTLDPLAGIPASVFQSRRADVFAALGDGIMVLPAAPLLYRSRDTEVPYRPDSELFWVTGMVEPGALAVLLGGAEPRMILFVPARDRDAELWSGPRMGPEEAAERFGADEVCSRSELDFRLPALLREGSRIHARMGVHADLDRMVVDALAWGRARGPRRGVGPRSVVDPGEILDDLRLVKEAWEVDRLRAASALSVEGHRAAAAAVAPGVGEWAVQAAVEGAFRAGGGSGPGFGTIVGSGGNACFLHYVDNGRVIGPGELVLVDAGAERLLYQGDITRVYPSSGRFTPVQRAVYEAVDAARAAAVDAVAPGVTVAHVHETAARVLLEGLVALRVLAGPIDDLLAQEAHKPFFPHQTSHWLGLDVHDVGDYARAGASRILEPGMVLTVEPGLYFPPGGEGAAAELAGLGVRVEDDVLVTESGHENLTAALPSGVDGIEALMAEVRG